MGEGRERRGGEGAYSARGRGRATPFRSGERRGAAAAAARGRGEEGGGGRRPAIFRDGGFVLGFEVVALATIGLAPHVLTGNSVRLRVT
jgi:hypothetical protein